MPEYDNGQQQIHRVHDGRQQSTKHGYVRTPVSGGMGAFRSAPGDESCQAVYASGYAGQANGGAGGIQAAESQRGCRIQRYQHHAQRPAPSGG